MEVTLMDINQELIRRIEELESYDIPQEKIKEILMLSDSPSVIKSIYQEMKQYYTVSQATKVLKPHLGKLKDDRSYRMKIIRLIETGELEAFKGVNNRQGYRISKTSVADYIKECEITKSEWRKRAKAAEAKVQKLEKQLSEVRLNEQHKMHEVSNSLH